MTPTKKRKEQRLKPCPWCNGPMIVLSKGIGLFEFVHDRWDGKCKAWPMMLGHTEEASIKAWNTRVK